MSTKATSGVVAAPRPALRATAGPALVRRRSTRAPATALTGGSEASSTAITVATPGQQRTISASAVSPSTSAGTITVTSAAVYGDVAGRGWIAPASSEPVDEAVGRRDVLAGGDAFVTPTPAGVSRNSRSGDPPITTSLPAGRRVDESSEYLVTPPTVPNASSIRVLGAIGVSWWRRPRTDTPIGLKHFGGVSGSPTRGGRRGCGRRRRGGRGRTSSWVVWRRPASVRRRTRSRAPPDGAASARARGRYGRTASGVLDRPGWPGDLLDRSPSAPPARRASDARRSGRRRPRPRAPPAAPRRASSRRPPSSRRVGRSVPGDVVTATNPSAWATPSSAARKPAPTPLPRSAETSPHSTQSRRDAIVGDRPGDSGTRQSRRGRRPGPHGAAPTASASRSPAHGAERHRRVTTVTVVAGCSARRRPSSSAARSGSDTPAQRSSPSPPVDPLPADDDHDRRNTTPCPPSGYDHEIAPSRLHTR